MVFVVAALAVVAIVLLVLLVRERTRVRSLSDAAIHLGADRDRALADAATAREQVVVALEERDDALDRAQRARRDAADVAARLRDATAAHGAAEDATAAARADAEARGAEAGELRRDLDEARAELARRPAGGEAVHADALWALLVDRVERLWRTSVAIHPEQPSPLRGTDPFPGVLDVLADAAHEESGADVTIEWSGDPSDVPPHRAVVAAAVVEALIGGLAKADGRVGIGVHPRADGVEIVVDADPDPVAGLVPDVLVAGPGRYVVP